MPKFQVLVRGVERVEAAGTVERLEWLEVSEPQYIAYSRGDPAWRTAKAASRSWIERTWRRITGGDA